MVKNFKRAQKILSKYNQEHLLYFFDKLNESEKNIIIEQILNTDFKTLNRIYENSFKDDTIDSFRISPIEYYTRSNLSDEEKEKYISVGESIIKESKIAVLTLAGGQGTRLGFKGPKGCYVLAFDEKKSLFELICDKLKHVFDKYGVYLNWYIMTSEDNDIETKKFFREKKYFGYPKNRIYFFKQHTIEIMDKKGKILLDKLYSIKRASNGNGDVFKAFKRYHLDNTLNNIDWISISGIDNITLEVVDPLFIGLTAQNKSMASSKSICKNDLESKDYVFAKVDNCVSIISPSNLTEEQKYSKKENGKYNYNQINILSHLFNKKTFLEIAKLKLPYHRAFRKNDFIDETGMKVVVKEPNSYKFENFIFDAFKYINNFTLLEVEEDEEFAPIKAFTGKYTPEIAMDLYCKKYNITRKDN